VCSFAAFIFLTSAANVATYTLRRSLMWSSVNERRGDIHRVAGGDRYEEGDDTKGGSCRVDGFSHALVQQVQNDDQHKTSFLS